MTEAGMPETIVEIKKWLQKHIAKNARRIDKNNQTIRWNNGESKWKPRGQGLCNWLRISTDAKRNVMIWTIDGNDYMKAEARKLADSVEEVIKKELNKTVSIEFKDATRYISNRTPDSQPESITIAHVGFLGVRQGKEPEAEQSSVVVHEIKPAVEDDDWF